MLFLRWFLTMILIQLLKLHHIIPIPCSLLLESGSLSDFALNLLSRVSSEQRDLLLAGVSRFPIPTILCLGICQPHRTLQVDLLKTNLAHTVRILVTEAPHFRIIVWIIFFIVHRMIITWRHTEIVTPDCQKQWLRTTNFELPLCAFL